MAASKLHNDRSHVALLSGPIVVKEYSSIVDISKRRRVTLFGESQEIGCKQRIVILGNGEQSKQFVHAMYSYCMCVPSIISSELIVFTGYRHGITCIWHNELYFWRCALDFDLLGQQKSNYLLAMNAPILTTDYIGASRFSLATVIRYTYTAERKYSHLLVIQK